MFFIYRKVLISSVAIWLLNLIKYQDRMAEFYCDRKFSQIWKLLQPACIQPQITFFLGLSGITILVELRHLHQDINRFLNL